LCLVFFFPAPLYSSSLVYYRCFEIWHWLNINVFYYYYYYYIDGLKRYTTVIRTPLKQVTNIHCTVQQVNTFFDPRTHELYNHRLNELFQVVSYFHFLHKSDSRKYSRKVSYKCYRLGYSIIVGLV